MQKRNAQGITLVARRRRTDGVDVDLRAALQRALRRSSPESLKVTNISRRPCRFHSSYRLEELKVQLSNGSVKRMIWKDLSPATRLKEARRIKPRFLYDPRREINVYREILPGLRLGTARCHGTVIDDVRERYWLFLEHVRGRHLWQFGEFDVWLKAARWLARMHVKSAAASSRPETRLPEAPLIQYREAFFRRWAERACRYVASPAFTDEQVSAVRRATRNYNTVAARLASFPAIFIHGEFYPSNILVCETPAFRVRPVDWEMAAVGPACIDLAALTAGGWTDAQRRELFEAYYAEMQVGAPVIDRSALREQLRYCSLHLAVQWLGWSRHWEPPAEHVQDWVAQALRASEELGL